MFNFFKKKANSEKRQFVSPVEGEVLTLEDVKDPVFSQKMMGDGFAVFPKIADVFSPTKGKITNIFPTKHAIGIETEDGLELLIHIGIDTVELKGVPFNIQVTEHQEVTEETLLVKIDLEALKLAEKDPTIMVIITNMEKIANLDIFQKGAVAAKQVIADYDLT